MTDKLRHSIHRLTVCMRSDEAYEAQLLKEFQALAKSGAAADARHRAVAALENQIRALEQELQRLKIRRDTELAKELQCRQDHEESLRCREFLGVLRLQHNANAAQLQELRRQLQSQTTQEMRRKTRILFQMKAWLQPANR